MAQALPVEIQAPGRPRAGGHAGPEHGWLLDHRLRGARAGDAIGFRLRLGRGYEPVTGSGRVVNAVPQNGSVRMGVAFDEMAPADRERLGFVIVDAVLKQFGH